MKESRTELFVGFFLLIGLVILGSLVLKFGNFNERFDNTYPLTVTFDDGGGLLKGTDVRLGGVKIGRVAESPKVNLENYRGAIVSLEIFDDFQLENSRNLGIRIITRSYEKTYDDNETREILMDISQTLESKFNITLNSSKND